jgi:mersacidin/lichenicidin family type 2 lantibiotic
MSNEDIVRAWKDAEYRQNLSAEEQTLLPEHPAGAIELPDDQLKQAAGGTVDWCLTITACVTACTCTEDDFCTLRGCITEVN